MFRGRFTHRFASGRVSYMGQFFTVRHLNAVASPLALGHVSNRGISALASGGAGGVAAGMQLLCEQCGSAASPALPETAVAMCAPEDVARFMVLWEQALVAHVLSMFLKIVCMETVTWLPRVDWATYLSIQQEEQLAASLCCC